MTFSFRARRSCSSLFSVSWLMVTSLLELAISFSRDFYLTVTDVLRQIEKKTNIFHTYATLMHYSDRLKQKHCSNRNSNIWPIYRLQPATSCSLSRKSKDTSFVSEIRIRSVISSISTLNFLPSGDLTSSWPSLAPPVNNRQKIGNY